jgi:hypothetical protein
MSITQPLNPSVAADGWSYVCLYLFIYYFSPIDHYKMIMDLSTGYNNSNITLNLKDITLHTDIKTTYNTIQMP